MNIFILIVIVIYIIYIFSLLIFYMLYFTATLVIFCVFWVIYLMDFSGEATNQYTENLHSFHNISPVGIGSESTDYIQKTVKEAPNNFANVILLDGQLMESQANNDDISDCQIHITNDVSSISASLSTSPLLGALNIQPAHSSELSLLPELLPDCYVGHEHLCEIPSLPAVSDSVCRSHNQYDTHSDDLPGVHGFKKSRRFLSQ